VARLERLPQRPLEEFWIAVAGPAVNVVIALVFGMMLLGTGLNPLNPALFLGSLGQLSFAQLVVVNMFVVNLFLALFNMLPAFPMDGGRVLRALLATRLGQLEATTIAAQIGVAMAILFGVIGLFANPMLTLLGIFVFFAGQQELAAVRYRYARRFNEPVDVLPAYQEELDWPEPATRAGFSGFTWDSGTDRWIEWRNGRPVHTISVN
jgi:stage IV sporulation protein FB